MTLINAMHLRLLMGPWLHNMFSPSCQLIVIYTPTCVMCGQTGQVRLSTKDAETFYNNSGLIQDDLPHLSVSIREQLMTGTHDACWQRMVDEGECGTCGEGEEFAKDECPKSQRSCGHHCNHSWTHDSCCWCGMTWGENGEVQAHA